MKRLTLLVATALVVTGCDARSTLAPESMEPVVAPPASQQTAGARCYGVQFDLLFKGPDFAGALVGGDLEGTVDIELLGFTDPTGRTNTATFEFTWNITGGVIPELIGASVVTEVSNRNLNQVPPPTPLGMAVGTHRVISGLQRANLTYIGEAQVVSLDPFAFENLLRHNGVICP